MYTDCRAGVEQLTRRLEPLGRHPSLPPVRGVFPALRAMDDPTERLF